MLFVLSSGTAAAKPGGNKPAPSDAVPMTLGQNLKNKEKNHANRN
jgi:hypothetical protein